MTSLKLFELQKHSEKWRIWLKLNRSIIFLIKAIFQLGTIHSFTTQFPEEKSGEEFPLCFLQKQPLEVFLKVGALKVTKWNLQSQSLKNANEEVNIY